MDDFDKAEPVRVLRFRGYALGWFRFFPMLLRTWPHVKDADLLLGINIASGGVIGRLSKLFYGKRYVTFGYAYEFLKFRHNPLAAALLRWGYRGSAVVVAISRFTRRSLVQFGVPDPLVRVILPGAPRPMALSAEREAKIQQRFVIDTDHLILSVGRLIPRKGQLTLIKAMPRILERFPNALLILVGQGPCMRKAVQLAKTLGVRNSVLFPGRLSDEEIAALYRACEVFALPTGEDAKGQVEGFGLVFTEAQAYGKPVVAGRSGGVEDAVIDGKTGLMVDPGNEEAVAEAVCRFLGDPEWAHTIGENGRKRVDSELNWTHFTRKLLDVVPEREEGAVSRGPK